MSQHRPPAFSLMREAGFWNELSDEDLVKVADLARVQQVDAGVILFRESAECDTLFLVVGGRVGLDMHVPRRGQVRILTIGPGDVLAWSALLRDQRMTAKASVLEAATLIALPAGKLKELCEADRDVGYAVMQRMAIALARRLLATRLQLLDLFGETQPA